MDGKRGGHLETTIYIERFSEEIHQIEKIYLNPAWRSGRYLINGRGNVEFYNNKEGIPKLGKWPPDQEYI